jgi:hypothetical protein
MAENYKFKHNHIMYMDILVNKIEAGNIVCGIGTI